MFNQNVTLQWSNQSLRQVPEQGGIVGDLDKRRISDVKEDVLRVMYMQRSHNSLPCSVVSQNLSPGLELLRANLAWPDACHFLVFILHRT